MSAAPAGAFSNPTSAAAGFTGDSTTLPGEDEVVARAASQP
jgi:hypothetical protein